MKVLCKYCKFLGSLEGAMGCHEWRCKHPLNVRIEYNWLKSFKEYDHTPEQINCDNSCMWFKPKWWVVWFVKESKWNLHLTKS